MVDTITVVRSRGLNGPSDDDSVVIASLPSNAV